MSTYSYATKCAAMHGMNADGGFGGELCADPYGEEVTKIVKRLEAEAPNDKNMCYNNFTDPCPKLTKQQTAMLVGFDYADKCKPLPFGPLPFPAGCPHPGYVPKTNPLTGRWVTITGGDAEFVKASIKSGMLGSAEASKIKADVNSKKTAGMFLRITQKGECCTVDASVAKYARAIRTWKSGHYFYEPLIGGSHLFGVWVLPEELRKIGFFWEVTSGCCFRIQRRAMIEGGFLFMRQSTEAFGKISHMFYIKASSSAETVDPPALQSRDFTALAGKRNVADNLGNPYPCEPIDLDAPIKRDAWYDANKAIIEKQMKTIGGSVANLESKEELQVGLGWSTEAIQTSVDALWEALTVMAKNPQKFMEVTDVTVSDEDGSLLRSMTITKNKTTVKERVFIDRETSEIVFQPIDLDTGNPKHLERVIAVKEEPFLHLEYYQRDLTDGMRSHWSVPASALREKCDKLVKMAKQLDGTTEPIVGLGFHSAEITNVDHDALWVAMVKEAQRPQIVMPKCVAIPRDGFVERMIVPQRAYVNEHQCELALRDIIDGSEQGAELAIILRAHPLELEVCERNLKSGFRVHSTMLKEDAQALMNGLLDAALKAQKNLPSTVGLGVVSAPVHTASYDSLFTAVENTIRQPWLVMDVEQSTFKGMDREGYYERTMKIKATGKFSTDHVRVNEEDGEIIFTEAGCPQERVVVVHKAPLRMEMYKRDARSKVRADWGLPYKAGMATMSQIVDMAKGFEDGKSDVIGYGMHSAPLDFSPDSIWRAMNFCVFSPDKCGIPVDMVEVKESPGYVTRSRRLLANNRVITEQIKVNERAQEVTFRTVKNGEVSDVEGVLALRTEPLRLELHSRCAKSEMKLMLKQPTSAGLELFNAIQKACGSPNMVANSDCTAKITPLAVDTGLPKFAQSSIVTTAGTSSGVPNSPKASLPSFAMSSFK